MQDIATLTMNPAIDVSYEVDRLAPTHKLRSHGERYDPGGGGINVARAIARLGGAARAHYLAGGSMGSAFDRLLDRHALLRCRIDIADDTRVSTAVRERETGQQYRFVPRGPHILPTEWQSCLDQLDRIEGGFLVASGSLPEGVPEDFYCRVQALTARRGVRLVLDSSGTALTSAVAAGGLFLIKPSLSELEQIAGRSLKGLPAIMAAAGDIVRSGKASHVAATMGADGAVLANASGTIALPAVAVATMSAVGAGDSFLAAMTFALASGREPVDAFRYGIAAGAAAVLNNGTELCHAADVERLFAQVACP